MEMAWSPPTGSVVLPADTLDVWAAPLNNRIAQWKELSATLSADERQRAGRFLLDEPRRRFIITRTTLRALLGKYLGLPPAEVALETGVGGKPRLAETQLASGLHFSVTHSGDLALIAVTTGCEVGVDVERVRSVGHAEHIARRFFHPAETKAIAAAGLAARDAAFLRCWTGKEAVLKATGSGITGSLSSLRLPTDEFETEWIELPAPISESHERCWLQALAPCRGYVGAVACLGEERRVRLFSFEQDPM